MRILTYRTTCFRMVAASSIATTLLISSLSIQAEKKYRIRTNSLQTHQVVPDKELLVTATEVVDSPHATYPGKLSFGYLMEQAFGKEKAPEIVHHWLLSWEYDFLLRDQTIKARKDVREKIILPWMKADGFEPGYNKEWKPNLANAPFNLLAVVNRMDMGANPESIPERNDPRRASSSNQQISPGFALPNQLPKGEVPVPSQSPQSRTNVYYGPSGIDSLAGEGRFIFGLTNHSGDAVGAGFTLILEYGLPANASREKLYQWAMDWHALGTHAQFDEKYIAALIEVTEGFTRRSAIVDGKVQGIAATQLLRIRTNDAVLGTTREFREFRLTRSNKLTPALLAGTPADIFFDTKTRENRALSRWLKDQEYNVLNNTPGNTNETDPNARADGALANIALPEKIKVGNRYVTVTTGASLVKDNDKGHHWDGRSLSEEMRRNFSMQSCTGCHCGETGTSYFHVAPRRNGEASLLSEFLDISGKEMRHKSPATRQRHSYQEIADRVKTLEAYLNPQMSRKEFKAIREKRKGRAH